MSGNLSKDFNKEARCYLYSVGLRAKGSRAKSDMTRQVKAMMRQIAALAKAEGIDAYIKLQNDDGTLGSRGIFFMQAPAKFAAQIRKIEGIYYVERPSEQRPLSAALKRTPDKKPAPRTKPRTGR